jgi:hypothetical protein
LWLGDGTFKVSPPQFYQLYTLHVIVFGKIIPVIYGLLKGKSETVYSAFFVKIYEITGGGTAKYFVCDFEIAVINTIKQHFQKINIHLCLFHFGQSIFRRIQALGLTNEYNNSARFRKMCKCITSLAFVPLNFVILEFIKLKELFFSYKNEKYDKLIVYFENTYINSGVYKLNMWNANVRLFLDLPLTTNAVEGFNSGFNIFFKSAIPH